jgi:membrane protease YdiL (CAAX protease family)
MIRAFARQHPRTIAIAVLLGFIAVLALPYLIWGPVDVTEGTGVVDFTALTDGIVWQALVTAVLVGIVMILGWADIAGFQGPLDKGGLPSTYWVSAYPMIGALGFGFAVLTSDTVSGPVMMITVVLTLNLLVGLSEEVLFRGIVFGALRQRHSLMISIIVSSVAFGMLHLVNLGIGQAISLTAFQVVNATALGALFCAIRLQTNSLWPPVLLHMMWNSYVMLGQAMSEPISDAEQPAIDASTDLTLSSFALPLILLGVAVWVLRNYVRRTGQSLIATVPVPQYPHPVSA